MGQATNITALLCLLAIPVAGKAQLTAPVRDPAFDAFVITLRPQALAAGIRAETFDSIAPTLEPDPRVIRLDRAQPGGNPTTAPSVIPHFAPYRASHIDRPRIEGGKRRYAVLRPLLAGVERDTGVPEAVMLAIYGHETGYGSFSGRYDLLTSFATLAYEGRRRELFTSEFIDTLRLIERGIPRSRLKGSWAGATGNPQFLPSAYLRLGRDGDGDGQVDIWTSEPDTLASIGNYLREAGWRAGEPWGIGVRVPDTLDREAIRTRLASPRCPRVHARHSRWLSIDEWRTLGLTLPSWAPADTVLASLIEPDGPGETAYLVTANYRAILDYNCSNFYALSVGLLADAIVN